MNDLTEKKPVRHLLGLSGGKDSSALAIYIRDKYPEIHEKMEYFFSDTGAELPETLDFINKLQDYLRKPIIRLNPEKDFKFYLNLNGNILPTAKMRWCTTNLKIRPFEEFVGSDEAITYVGIRADEPQRQGYISTKPNISARYPFMEDGKDINDIRNILKSSGIDLPAYYEWRSRSGCYFCFFQRKEEWIGLHERHPDLYEEAMKYEEFHKEHGRDHTWSDGERLEYLKLPKRIAEIKEMARLRKIQEELKPKKNLMERNCESADDLGCLACHL